MRDQLHGDEPFAQPVLKKLQAASYKPQALFELSEKISFTVPPLRSYLYCSTNPINLPSPPGEGLG